MTSRTRTLATVVASLAAVALVAGCQGSDPKPEPTKAEPTNTTTTSSNVADAPPWPTLTAKEKAAVKAAFAGKDAAGKVSARLTANPKAAMRNDGEGLKVLRAHYYSPSLNNQARTVRELAEKNGRFIGHEKTEWRVPTTVDLESKKRVIEFQECSSLGSFRVVQDGKNVAQETEPLVFTIKMSPAYKDGKVTNWRVSEIKETGKCGK